MRSLTRLLSFALPLFFVVPGSLAVFAQANAPGPQSAKSAVATREEVEELRREVAAQRQTIEEMKAMLERLATVAGAKAGGGQLVNATLVQPATSENAVAAEPAEMAAQKAAASAPKPPALTAGWNGEHFFVKSADGNFQIQPYGYVQTDYRAYRGDGAPPNTFLIRRGRFGFQGNYGSHYDFAVLLDAAAGSGAVMRDIFFNVKAIPAFQVQVGQFKEPFAQDEMTAVPNIDFVERSLASLLYPSAATAYRSPGVSIHGDIAGAVMQYWVSAFNGKGIGANNTTNEPELIGRLRFYPWRKKKNNLLQGLAFGGAFAHGRSRGLSNETSFGGTVPSAAYNFFPSFRINGGVERYNGEFAWTHGPWGLKGEYVQLNQFRHGVGSETGGLGFLDIPGVVAKAWYGSATYLLTGEARPENGVPKVKHPLFGPETPGGGGPRWGAWELAFRYSAIHAKAAGATFPNLFTPAAVPTFNDHTDEFTAGINWYPNYWTRYMLDFNVDRLKDPSVTGALPQKYFVILQRLQFRF